MTSCDYPSRAPCKRRSTLCRTRSTLCDVSGFGVPTPAMKHHRIRPVVYTGNRLHALMDRVGDAAPTRRRGRRGRARHRERFRSRDRSSDVLRGTWLDHPLHPMLTDLPIGFWTSAWVLDIVGGEKDRDAARRLIGAGVLCAVPAAFDGRGRLVGYRRCVAARRSRARGRELVRARAVRGFVDRSASRPQRPRRRALVGGGDLRDGRRIPGRASGRGAGRRR